jgi:hypothetical protein
MDGIHQPRQKLRTRLGRLRVGLTLFVGCFFFPEPVTWLLRLIFPHLLEAEVFPSLVGLTSFFYLCALIPGLFQVMRACRRIDAMREPESADLIASWTVEAADWERFRQELRQQRTVSPLKRAREEGLFRKAALSLCDLESPPGGVEIRIGCEAILVGDWYFALEDMNLSEVAPARSQHASPVWGMDLLAFIVLNYTTRRHDPSVWEAERIGLLLPVPQAAEVGMQRVLSHFASDAIPVLHALDRRYRQIHVMLNLMFLVAAVSMILQGYWRIAVWGLTMMPVWMVWSLLLLVWRMGDFRIGTWAAEGSIRLQSIVRKSARGRLELRLESKGHVIRQTPEGGWEFAYFSPDPPAWPRSKRPRQPPG